MRVLVTGGAGFIGSHLVDALLDRGDDVSVAYHLNRSPRPWVGEALRRGVQLHVARRGTMKSASSIESTSAGRSACRSIEGSRHCLRTASSLNTQMIDTRDRDRATYYAA